MFDTETDRAEGPEAEASTEPADDASELFDDPAASEPVIAKTATPKRSITYKRVCITALSKSE